MPSRDSPCRSTSPSSKSSSSDDTAPATRPRVGRRKVRTGCITCKIRRVKCDEATPACKRCASTGRKCDGYGPRPKPNASQHSDLELVAAPTKCAISRLPHTSSSPPLLRPLIADISGDRMERLYFHRFKDIGEEALGIRHIHNGLFWKQIVPQYCYEVPSVKHAYIAFSAAYLNFHVSGKRPDALSPPSQAESFVISQYNLALQKISDDCKGLPLRRRYGITMMCCVAFFCIEVLRGEWEQGLAHLSNGLKMMSDLPDDVADILHNPAKWSRGLDTSYVRVSYMIKLLTRWEVSVGYLAADFQPWLTTKAFKSRQLNLHVPGSARSVEELQDIVDDFCQDVNAFAYLARHGQGAEEYWVDPAHRLQYWALKQRADNIAPLFAEQCEIHGSYQPGSLEYIALHVSLLNHRASSLALDLLPFSGDSNILSPAAEAERTAELVRIAETINDAHGRLVNGSSDARSHVDLGVVPTLHVAAKLCNNAGMREKLHGLIQAWPRKESVWNGPVLRSMQVC